MGLLDPPLLDVLGVVLDDPDLDEPDRDEPLGDLTSEEDDLEERGETMGEDEDEDEGEVEEPLEEEVGGGGASEVGPCAWNSEVGFEWASVVSVVLLRR